LHSRTAFSVLCLISLLFARGAWAQPTEAQGSAPAAPTQAPPPPAAPSTPGYTDPSTAGYAPVPPPPAPLFWYAPPPPYVPPPLAFEMRDHRYSDAHVDRVIIAPTAETHPEGTLYLSSYEIVLLQAGYAVTDRTQVTLTSMPPLPNEKILPLDLTLKTVVARAPEYRVAALASVSGIAGIEQGTVVVGRLGGVAQLCFERTCRSSVSVATNVLLVGQAIITSGVGLVVRGTDHVSVLLEVDSLVPVGRDVAIYGGLAIGPGIRFSGEHLALDLAFMHALDVLEGPGVPFLAATYRTGSK
jgi:hypothetical protein